MRLFGPFLRRRLPHAAWIALSVAAVDHGARADVPARPMVKWMADALTDSRGKVPLLIPIPTGETAASLGVREIAPGVGAIRLSPEDAIDFGDAFPGLPIFVEPRRHTLLDRSVPSTGAPVFRAAAGVDGSGTAVGVVDTGIDITHPTFIDENGKTRIAWLLTWGNPRGVHADIEDALGCTADDQEPCAVYSADDIDAMLASKAALPVDVRDNIGHGTHVASIAAGNGGDRDGLPRAFIGMAPGAKLIIANPSVAEGFADDEILRGANFVFNRGDLMGVPTVLNLSIGSDFGPHDGTSTLEKGLSAFVGDDKPGHVVVVAAGNSGARYDIGTLKGAGIHTTVHVDRHSPVKVPVLTPQASSGAVFVWITFRSGDSVKVGLDGPDGTWVPLVGPGEDAGFNGKNDARGSVINDEVDARSSLTNDSNGAVVSWSGNWTEGGPFNIVLEGEGDAEMWLEPEGPVSAVGAYFERATVEGTLSTPATAPSLLAVGCLVNRNTWPSIGHPTEPTTISGFAPDDVCFFSSAGPTATGLQKPEILAPGGFIGAAMSTDADPRKHVGGIFDASGCPAGDANCFVINNSYAVAAGTSMSAPHVAGAVSLLLAHDPNLTQSKVTRVIQASARYPKGLTPVQAQLGPGALDLSQAMTALASEEPSDVPVDSKKSWWTLSTNQAEPDLSRPVTGLIELREADGTIASGLDGTKLAVLADGGTVVTNPTKISQGLFRFQVAGAPGEGGTTMHVEVLYDGVPIRNQMDIAIAVDPWISAQEVSATGGCAFSSEGPGSLGGWSIAVGTLAAIGISRRRRRR